MYLQFSLFTIGNYSSRLWAALLAISLLFLQCRSLCFVLKLWPLFVSVAWGVPTVLVIALLFLDQNNISTNEKRNPNFQYGNAQAAVSIFLLVMCFIGKCCPQVSINVNGVVDFKYSFWMFQSPVDAWCYTKDTRNDLKNISAYPEKLAWKLNRVSAMTSHDKP